MKLWRALQWVTKWKPIIHAYVESGISSWAYLEGAAPGALLNRPIVQEIFAIEYIVWHQQWTATAAEQRRTLLRQHSAVCKLQLQQRQVSKCLPTADHPKNAASNGVWVWARLFYVAANADVHSLYHDGRSTRGASLAAMPPRALSYARQCAKKARRLNFVSWLKLLKL